MDIALIGFGQAGGKIADKFCELNGSICSDVIESKLAINTASEDLTGLSEISSENHILLGEDRLGGNGVGENTQLGREVAEADVDSMVDAVTDIPTHNLDAFFITTSLGGGTGAGGSPVLANELQKRYEKPVYAVGVLPAIDEGGLNAMNASLAMRTLQQHVTSLFPFDNEAWRDNSKPLSEEFDTINTTVATRVLKILATNEEDSTQTPERVIDASEITNTLDAGHFSAIGYSSEDIAEKKSMISRFLSPTRQETDTADANLITSLTRRALQGQLTFPCSRISAERCLVVISGPPDKLNRQGIERAKAWIESETDANQVRCGDIPTDSTRVEVTVLLSGITYSERIQQVQQFAVEAKHDTETLADRTDLEALIRNDYSDPHELL